MFHVQGSKITQTPKQKTNYILLCAVFADLLHKPAIFRGTLFCCEYLTVLEWKVFMYKLKNWMIKDTNVNKLHFFYL